MRLKSPLLYVLIAAVAVAVAGCPLDWHSAQTAAAIDKAVLRWNKLAVDASGLDHAPVAAGENRTFGHQLGPARSSRAMAIVHIAIFDALNAIEGGYQSYTRLPRVYDSASRSAAVAQAARDTLVALFPSQSASFDAALAEDLAAIADARSRDNGVQCGKDAAAAILAMRALDGSEQVETYEFDQSPGKWRKDPLNPNQPVVGNEWYRVKPFVINSATQFRCPAPPALDSAEYATAFNEVKELGGDGVITPTSRTADQTEAGIYWAYDGTPSLCAPPRLYNQIALQIGQEQGITGMELARLAVLVNVAMADACIAIWESKFHYNVWRPVTGIREADTGTGPTGIGDGNEATTGDASFVPLCAPASNLLASNFTPPFPAYPSGHAGFGGALFEVLREFVGTDDVTFTFVSDEYNGVTRDNAGNVRPLKPRTFTSLSQAEEENGQSRIYLGIHWAFDKTAGITQGNDVAQFVVQNAFAPK